MNCIASLLRYALSLYLDLKEQFYQSVEKGYDKMEQMKLLHTLTESDDVVGATIDMMSHCNIVDESTELLDQLGMVYPSGGTNHDEAVQELSARIQEGGSERSRLAERIGYMFKTSGGSPPSDPDSSDVTTVSSHDTNPYDNDDYEGGAGTGSQGYEGDDGGDGDDSDNNDENRFSSFDGSPIDPSTRLVEETRILQAGERTESANDGNQGLAGYAPVAVHQREVKLITKSELASWQKYLLQSKETIVLRTKNETITSVWSPKIAIQYWLENCTRLNVKDHLRSVEKTFERLMTKNAQRKSPSDAFTVPKSLFSSAAKWDRDNFSLFITIPVQIRMCMVMTKTALDSLEYEAEMLYKQDPVKYKALHNNICDEKNGVRSFTQVVHQYMTEFVTYILRVYKEENRRFFDAVKRQMQSDGNGVMVLPGMHSDLLVRELVMVLGHIDLKSKTHAPTLEDAIENVKNFSLNDHPDRKLADHLYEYYELIFAAIGLGDEQYTGFRALTRRS